MTRSIRRKTDRRDIRLTSSSTNSTRFVARPPAAVQANEGDAIAKAAQRQASTLEQRLTLFDPTLHGAEVMAAVPLDTEKLA